MCGLGHQGGLQGIASGGILSAAEIVSQYENTANAEKVAAALKSVWAVANLVWPGRSGRSRELKALLAEAHAALSEIGSIAAPRPD
jgi:hypothetical protein